MFKIKSTKRALLAAVLALVVSISMLVGSTFAWFTDSVTSGQNKIQSGNLDVELYYTYDAAVAADVDSTAWVKVTDTTDVFGYNLWEPGYTKVAYFKVVNEGSLALKYKLSADVYAEVPGVNKAGNEFLLSDYIKTAVVDTAATRDSILAMTGTPLKASYAMSAKALAANASEVVGLAVWMPTTVGNDANHNGTDVPSVTFGINLIATQEMSESDSFGTDYDISATYPKIDLPAVLSAGAVVEDGVGRYDIGLFSEDINDDGEFAKQGSIVVYEESIDPNAESVEFIVTRLPVVDSTVDLNPGESAITIDIVAHGIVAGNTTPIEITANIGAGLGTVRLFHKDEEIPIISYNNTTGVLKFETTSFSPFTIAYDVNKQPADTEVPQAVISNETELQNTTLDWQSGMGFADLGEQQLNAVYKFAAPHDATTVQNSIYKDWECDYVVRLNSDTLDVLPEEYIVLGGNYGEFGWLGFANPVVDTNSDIPLLGSVTESAWTYADVVGFVKEFICGVGIADANKEAATAALNGAEFVVMLRLTNPENGKYINVATVTYDFATKTSTLETSKTLWTPVSSGQEIQDAIDNGDENIVLDGDMDLSQGLIIS